MFSREDRFRERVISRFRSILELEELLKQLLKQAPRYAPVEFHTTVPALKISHTSSSQIISSLGARESQETISSEQSALKTFKKDHKSSTMKFKSVDELRPFMRAFHVSYRGL